MRQARDTFLHYLADNQPYKVRNLRQEPGKPDAQRITAGAINVQFLADNPQVTVGELLVSIDIVADSELDAVDMQDAVFKLLSVNSMCPQLDYTNPQSPQPTGTNLYWDPRGVNFRPIFDKLYSRWSCLLSLSYHPQ